MQSQAMKFHDPDERYDSAINDPEAIAENPLDSLEKEKLLQKLNDWWYETRVASSENRLEQAIDDDFVDGLQWFDEDVKTLADRNQEPLVFNEIKPAVEWVIGTEKRTRIDWKVYPRTDDDRKAAEVKTKLLKYVSDVNKLPFVRSKAFESATKNGVGWLELGMKGDTDDEPLFIRNESWRNIWYDHLSVEDDISDARYLCRSKITDLDISIALFPDRKYELESEAAAVNQIATQADDDFYESQLYYQDSMTNSPLVRVGDALAASQGRRQVVRLIEVWYREIKGIKIFKSAGSEYDGNEYSVDDVEMLAEMDAEMDAGHGTLHDSVRMEIRVAIFIEGGKLLQDMKSPYNHNRFPFVPIWGYRRSRDNQPYGVVRNARDPQMDLNKRRSKALFLLSVNRTIMEEGAVDDMDEYEDEVSRPDAIIVKKKGKSLEIETNIRLAEEHLDMSREDGEYIRQSSGVTGENLGLETNAASGKAITARQNQGTVVTASLFDNSRYGVQLTGEIMLSLVEQFYTDEKIVRIAGERGKDEFLTINQYDPVTGTYVNDITASQADFKVSEQDHSESLRTAMFEQLMSMIGQLDSHVALDLLDLVFEFSDLPGKDEIVRRIRKLNGQIDPDDTEAEDKEAAANAVRQQKQEAIEALENREREAAIREKESKADKTEAETDNSKMESLIKALEAALQALQTPEAAIVAQDLLDDVPLQSSGSETKRDLKAQADSMMQQQQLTQPITV